MKREVLAAALLILTLALLLVNIHALEGLVGELEEHVCRSSAALARGDREHAVSELEAAMTLWQSAEGYTHVFVRHSEIDAVSDAFFELNAALRGGDEADDALYLALLYHLDSIEKMDELRLGSIF